LWGLQLRVDFLQLRQILSQQKQEQHQ
jgi:hypothetical protein